MTSSYLGVLPQLGGGVVAAPADVAHPRVLPGLVRAVRVRVQSVLKCTKLYRVVQLNFTPEIEVFKCCLRDPLLFLV